MKHSFNLRFLLSFCSFFALFWRMKYSNIGVELAELLFELLVSVSVDTRSSTAGDVIT
jgi:hypothetical protein